MFFKKTSNYIILQINIQKVKMHLMHVIKIKIMYHMHLITQIYSKHYVFYYIEEKSFTLSKCIPSRTSKTSLIISSATNFTLKIFHEKFNDFATIKILIRQSKKIFRISTNSLNNHIFPKTIV